MNVLSAQDCLSKFGEPGLKTEGSYMTLFDVPVQLEVGVIPKKIYCNKLLVTPLTRAFGNLITRINPDTGKAYVEELITWDGCYQVRKQRGYNSLSIHCWGLAVDVNQAWNQLGKEPTLSAGFVKCFTDAGFDWGGLWGRKDGMHFQLAKNKLV